MKLGTRERLVDPAWTLPTRRPIPRFPKFPYSFPMAFPAGRKEGRKEGRKQGRLAEKEGKERKGKLSWGLQGETELGQHSTDCDADYTQAGN